MCFNVLHANPKVV